MSEATEKQISYAKSLGIENPSQFTKEALAELISAKTGSKPKPASSQPALDIGKAGVTQGISDIKHEFQSEYEFGPAGNRHKIKYVNIEELKVKMKELEEAGYLVDYQKIE